MTFPGPRIPRVGARGRGAGWMVVVACDDTASVRGCEVDGDVEWG
jgi:hypothetical protein